MTYIYKIYNKKKIIFKNKLKSTVKHKNHWLFAFYMCRSVISSGVTVQEKKDLKEDNTIPNKFC